MASDSRHLSIIVEDKPSASKSPAPLQRVATDNDREPVSPVPESPVKLKGGRGRSASHVSIEYFDPTGVQALERQLSRESALHPTHSRTRSARSPPPGLVLQHRASDSSTTIAAPVDGEQFDFARAVRQIMRKCVNCVMADDARRFPRSGADT